MKSIPRFIFLFLLILCPLISNAKKFNVLMIVIDDLRTELNCYGAEGVYSPAIDKFAAKAMCFENAYAQYPVCNPSRSSFLSGLRPNEVGVISNTIPLRRIQPDLITLPQLFRENGYFTAGIGKIFHLSVDSEKKELFADPKSWDYFYCALADHNYPALGKKGEGRNVTNGKVKWANWLAAEGGDIAQPDGINNQELLRVLDEKKEEAFFIGYGIHKPHDPFIAPKEYFEHYPLNSIQLPKEPENRSKIEKLAIPGQGREFATMTDKDRKEFVRAYRAGVSFADAQLEKAFEALTRFNLWDNTIVIIMGDHGYHLGEHDWWNKVTLYEWGARSPMLIWVPGETGMGQSTTSIMEFIDLYPTLIDYAELKAPHKLSGVSLRPILENPQNKVKDAAYTQVTRGSKMGYSVRNDKWRYTEWGPSGEAGIELYNHDKDSGEYYNLASNPEFEPIKKQMQSLLAKGFSKR